MIKSFTIFCIISLLNKVSAKTAEEWKTRTIYQLLTDRFAGESSESWIPCIDLTSYCSGNYKGMIEQLDYIQGMGFDAIWISPFVLNSEDAYHGYFFLDMYQVNPHFGTADDLRALVDEAHNRDIWVMMDVVANHVAPVDMSFELINPFNESIHYHDKCVIEDWNNQEQVETCRLVDLPDLDQNNTFVRTTLIDWVSTLTDDWGFDGFRIDTVPEIHPDFWEEYTAAAGSYCVGEVFNADIGYVSSYQPYFKCGGNGGVFHYPLFYTIRDVFAYQKSMTEFEGVVGPDGSYEKAFLDVTTLGVFVDNHDNTRFLFTQSDYALYKNALTMVLYNTGIPVIYYGTEQGYNGGVDPLNRESLWPNYNTEHELYQFIKALISARKSFNIATESQVQRYAAYNFYAFSRGDVLVCMTNVGSYGGKVAVQITYHPYTVGTRICDQLNDSGTPDCITVTTDGFQVELTDGLPKVYAPA